MTSRFIVLASGSSGNANLLQTDSFGVLIDCGLGPQELSARLQSVGASWQSVNAVVLTHTHSDHWNKYTLEHLRRLNIPLVAHARHHNALSATPQYAPLARAGLVREYTSSTTLSLGTQLKLRAIQVPHDSDPTFAIRIDAGDQTAPTWSVGLASDLGRVPEELIAFFTDIDVLGIEFNHDESLERASRRPRFLVERVLGDFGHLSNRQAADGVRILAKSERLAAVVQLHLSRDCNSAELAAKAGQAALQEVQSRARLLTASQHHPTAAISLVPQSERTRTERPKRSIQFQLPGME